MIYIKIHGNNLQIAHIQHNKVCAYKSIDLPDQTIYQDIIFCPNNILIHINEFIKEQKINKPWTIINVPELQNKQAELQTLAIFQFALLLSKANIKIQKIISIPQISDQSENKTDESTIISIINSKEHQNFLQQIECTKKSVNPLIWLITTALFITLIIITLSLLSNNKLKESSNLQKSQTNFQTQISQMQEQIKDLTNLRKQNTDLTTTINKAQTYLSKNKNPLELLMIFAEKIPNNTWLTKIELGQDSKFKNMAQNSNSPSNRLPNNNLEIVGYGLQIDSPLKFIENLSTKANSVNSLYLKYLKKTKAAKTKQKNNKTSSIKKYEFKICGKLTIQPTHAKTSSDAGIHSL